MSNFTLEIVTPEAKVFEGLVQSVQVPGSQGSFQVLYNHAPLISTLGSGRLRLVNEGGKEVIYQISDGVIEVLNNKTIVLVEQLTEAAEA
jgi:F-type H+-transporting ATPase subunit epsilon